MKAKNDQISYEKFHASKCLNVLYFCNIFLNVLKNVDGNLRIKIHLKLVQSIYFAVTYNRHMYNLIQSK